MYDQISTVANATGVKIRVARKKKNEIRLVVANLSLLVDCSGFTVQGFIAF